MYQCEFCKTTIQRNIKSKRVVVQYRIKNYPPRRNAIWGPDKTTGKYKWNDDPGGTGYEIVKEKLVCCDCEKKILEERVDG